MSKSYRYHVVDVFAERPLSGNPLAVFLDASELESTTMQKIAREFNLSETAFILPPSHPGCAVTIRIFTPAKEMAFAGHPTIGTAFVMLLEGVVPASSEHFLVEEKVGTIPIRVEQGQRPLIWLTTPPIREGDTYDPDLCMRVLGLTGKDLLGPIPQLLSAGNPTIFVALKDQHAVDRAWLDLAGLKELKNSNQEPMCVFAFTPTSEGAYSRMFAPEYGIAEDPATGSSTGPLAEFMMRNKLISGKPGTRFVSEQGTKMGRRSILHVNICGAKGQEGIEVGGHVTPVVTATMTLEGI